MSSVTGGAGDAVREVVGTNVGMLFTNGTVKRKYKVADFMFDFFIDKNEGLNVMSFHRVGISSDKTFP